MILYQGMKCNNFHFQKYFQDNRSVSHNINILEHNRLSWDKQSSEGSPWSKPVDSKTISDAKNGNWSVILTPLKPVPKNWFGDISQKDVLCLASGGGQQAPVLAAAGAQVISFDYSEEQLKKDKMVAEQNGLSLKIIQGDMADLSIFENETFDLIFHPVSNVFVPDVNIVWKECYRVLRNGGVLLSGFMNPVFYLFDFDDTQQTKKLTVKYKLPYSDVNDLDEKRQKEFFENKTAFEFGHLLQDQIGGQIEAGFVITGFYEDWWSDDATLLNKYSPTFIASKAVKY